jgi:hypothetical protein
MRWFQNSEYRFLLPSRPPPSPWTSPKSCTYLRTRRLPKLVRPRSGYARRSQPAQWSPPPQAEIQAEDWNSRSRMESRLAHVSRPAAQRKSNRRGRRRRARRGMPRHTVGRSEPIGRRSPSHASQGHSAGRSDTPGRALSVKCPFCGCAPAIRPELQHDHLDLPLSIVACFAI